MMNFLKLSLRSVFFSFFAFVFCSGFVSCIAFNTDDSNSTSSTSNSLADFSSDSDCEISNMKIVDSSSNSVTLTGLTEGQPILFVNFNRGTSSISSKNVRCTVSGDNLNTSSSGNVIPYSTSSSHSFSGRSAGDSSLENKVALNLRHFVPPVSNSELFVQANVSSRAADSENDSDENVVTVDDFTVDSSTKEIFIDCSTDLASYKKASATLRAIGYNGGYTEEDAETQNLSSDDAVCLVWVVNDYYDESTSSEEKVNSTVAHSIAEKFGKYYSLERSIFGCESDYLLTSAGKIKSTTMAADSTGTLVNIVLYDIGADYGSSSECGVAGYFYSKDYFESSSSYSSSSVLNYTNEGKYFYIDTPYCNYVSSASDKASNSVRYAGTGDVSGTAITTLFHEFQHMINWNTKSYKNLDPSTWYNEMLSMLAEDILATVLELEDSDDAVWNARIPYYNEYYYYSALDEYRNDDYAVLSYSTAYALGSYLARNYGGIEFVSALSQNEYVDWDSILNAVQSASSQTKSKLALYQEVIAASVFRNEFAESNDLPSFNVAKSSSSYSYADGTFENLEMPEIDIYSDSYKYSYSSSSSSLLTSYYIGPLIMKSGVVSSSGLRAHGFNIHFAGYATSDTVTLTFASSSGDVDSNEQILVFWQDEFSNKADSDD